MVPFEYQGDDEVWVHLYSPVTLFPGRIGLRVVGGQDDAGRAGQIPTTCRCHKRGRFRGEKGAGQRERRQHRVHRRHCVLGS